MPGESLLQFGPVGLVILLRDSILGKDHMCVCACASDQDSGQDSLTLSRSSASGGEEEDMMMRQAISRKKSNKKKPAQQILEGEEGPRVQAGNCLHFTRSTSLFLFPPDLTSVEEEVDQV